MAAEKTPPGYAERRAIGKLEIRQRYDRLMAVADAARPKNPELERLRCYLLDWARAQRDYKTGPKSAGSVLGSLIKSPNIFASDLLGESDGWAMSVIDAAVSDLVTLPEGLQMQAALRARYLNEVLSDEAGMRVRVFRSGRLEHLSLMEADALADRAELAMIPMVKRKDLPL